MDALSLTVSRLSPSDLIDMFSLGVAEGVSKSLGRDLDVFAKRIENEVADLPDGGPIAELVIALQDIPAERIPLRFRELLTREAERETRAKGERGLLKSLLDSLEGVEPEAFPLGEGAGPRVTSTEEAPPKSSLKSEKSTKGKAKSTRSKKVPVRSARAVVVDNPDQTKWLRRLLMERLSGYSESGLAEVVLMAGVRHAAREEYPHLINGDIMKVLKALKETGQIRYSAGRWSLPSRW